MINERKRPLQYHINDAEFDMIEEGARGGAFHPSMKGYVYLFCVLLFFFRKIKALEAKIANMENKEELGEYGG